ncbi:dixin-A-like isoform X2 [Uloborus diversus]|uniref:dixin-A-like isoform X2 n=1 Tax=Uloborus diversus TaxID=327109 RepID=UPI002409652D|nr:dixin-A-like isoform X2 [Uloborus diversus]
MKLKRTIEEQEQEIARLKLSISSQAKNFKYPYSAPARMQVSSPTLRKSLYERDATSITAHVQDETSEKQLVNSNSTKVVYYMDKSLTPFRCIMHKRIGEATLRDFKILFDRPGQYRYHFKTLDPEFGMVKEEVLHDDDILPGWDSKIVAWIEEDCS